MALYTKAITFDAATVTGNQSVSWASSANWPAGTVPKALMLWGSGGSTDDVFETIWFTQGLGFATSPTNQFAQASCAFASSSTGVRRRIETCAFIQTSTSSTAIIRRANLVSMDSDGLTLNWTIARADAAYDVIHGLVLGGDDLTGARVVNWQTPTAIGNKAVTGVGFQPDCALHAHAGVLTALTDGSGVAATASFGLGAMTASGGQWATGYITNSTSAHARNQESDKTLTLIDTAGVILNQANYVSMDSDGFTVNFGTTQSTAYQVISLCLKGGQYNAGRIVKSTAAAPVSQAVTGTGFTPTGVLLAGVQDIVRAAPLVGSGVAYGLGASDGTTEWGSALYGAATATRKAISKTTKAYVKVNTTGSVIDAEADLTSFDADGLTLGWTTNDAVATSMLYLAMGSNPAGAAHPLTTTIAGTSSVTASAIRLSQPLSGAVVGSSTATATALRLAHPLAATVSASSTATATALALSHPLAAGITATWSATASSIRLNHPLASTVAGTSSVGAALAAPIHPLTSAVTASSAVTAGQLTLSHPLTATAASAATTAATGLIVGHALTATVASASTATATSLRLVHPLVGSVSGPSAVTANGIRLAHPLSGTVASTSAVTAERITLAHALAGIIAATSTATASGITAAHPLTAGVTAASTVTGALVTPTGTHPLTATIAGTSSIAASALGLDQPLTSLVAGLSTVAASGIRIDQPLTGAVTGSSTATALRLVISHPLAAIVAATSTATADRLTLNHPLIASSAGTSSVVALISLGHPLAAVVAGSSTVTAVFIVPITSAITFAAPDRGRTFDAADRMQAYSATAPTNGAIDARDRAGTYAATDPTITYDGGLS